MSTPNKRGLSEQRGILVDSMRHLWFGSVSNVHIHDGEPDLTRATALHEIKLDQDYRPRPPEDDFLLKQEIVRLFEHFDRLGDAVIRIEVRHGLPTRIIVETGSPRGGK